MFWCILNTMRFCGISSAFCSIQNKISLNLIQNKIFASHQKQDFTAIRFEILSIHVEKFWQNSSVQGSYQMRESCQNHILATWTSPPLIITLNWGIICQNFFPYILKAEKVVVMDILANKNWRKRCVNLDKTKIATKVRKLWKWKESLTSCWNKASFPLSISYIWTGIRTSC